MMIRSEPYPHFRHLPRIVSWTHTLELPELPFDELVQKVQALVAETQLPVLGHVTGRRLILSRHPSPRYGTPHIHECEEVLRALRTQLGAQTQPHDPKKLPAGFRVIMGRRAGYEPTAQCFTPGQARTVLRGCSVTETTLLSVRWLASELRTHTEPAICIQGGQEALNSVYDLAHAWRQEQFSVQDFTTSPPTVFTVITAWRS